MRSERGAQRLDSVAQFLAAFWARHPVTATFAGIAGHDQSLPDWSPEGLDRSLTAMRAERRTLAPVLRRAELALGSHSWPACADLIDLRLADATLEIEQAEREGQHFIRGNPSLAISEATFGLISVMLRRDLPLESRWSDAALRLGAIPDFLAGAQRALERRIPAAWRDRARRECAGASRLLADGVRIWVGSAGGPAVEELLGAVAPALAAVRGFDAWLADVAPIDEGNDVAIGRETYDLLLQRGHWSTRSSAAWLPVLRERFAAARGTLAGMAGALAPGGWREVEARLAGDLPAPDDYLTELTACWNACRDLAVERALAPWPPMPVRFAPTALWTRSAAPDLYYLPYRSPPPVTPPPFHLHEVAPLETAPDGSTRVPRAMTRAQIKLNHVVHHAGLGHHVQNWHAAQSASRVGQVAAVDGASRIAMFVGGSLAEGWACYATDLMEEVGFLTPLERVAEQHTRVRLLARGLMDIELHTGERSLDDVAAFYEAEVGMSAAAARAEAVKNSMFPGTAIMYWLGLDGLHELRLAESRRLGDAFNLGAFHQQVLAMGSIPVPLVAERMRAGMS